VLEGLPKIRRLGKLSPFVRSQLLTGGGISTAREGFCQYISSLAVEICVLYKGRMVSERMLTTSEVATRLNVSLRRVRQLIEEGRLPSQQFGRDHLIKESDLILVENRKVGRPPKAKAETGSKASKKRGGKK
jgi:excisionase family DNA binding protein